MKTVKFWILISIVLVSGLSQGMLLPLIAIIFEKAGITSSFNGIHATSLYIGVLLASPFMEKPLRKFGYKPLIAIGTLLVCMSLAFFPFWESFWFWFVLRLVIGIGDHMLHFGIQTWITADSPIHKRGKNIALYGLFFGVGFMIGPMLTRLVEVNEHLPFLISALISFIAWLGLLTIRNEKIGNEFEATSSEGTFKRFYQATRLGWAAFLLPFGYGFLEASLHGNFPVYALRKGIEVSEVSYILPAFAAGSLISQLPLGILSDKIGRKIVVILVLIGGVFSFFIASFVEQSPFGLFLCFTISGMLVGSTFSLGISYMSDLLPKDLLPAGNILCGVAFSLGSIVGPLVGGIYIEHVNQGSFFYIISTMLLVLLAGFLVFNKPQADQISKHEIKGG